MRKFAAVLVWLGLMVGSAYGACVPSSAMPGSIGCLPQQSSTLPGDYIMVWRPSLLKDAANIVPLAGAVLPVSGVSINIGNFTAPTNYPPAMSASPVGVVFGSPGTPDNTATPAVYFEKIGTGAASLGVNAAFSAVSLMTGSAWGSHMAGIFSRVQSTGAQPSGSGDEPYIEAGRFEALSTGTIAANTEGLIAAAGTNGTAPYSHLTAGEFIVENLYDAPTTTFNRDHNASNIVLSAGYGGSSPGNVDTGIYFNSYSPAQWMRGILADTDTIAAAGIFIEGRGHMAYGLNLQFATGMNAWAVIPNNVPLNQISATGSLLNILNLSGANTLTVGQDTGLANVAIASAAVPTNILGSATIGGTLGVTGAATFSGALNQTTSITHGASPTRYQVNGLSVLDTVPTGAQGAEVAFSQYLTLNGTGTIVGAGHAVGHQALIYNNLTGAVALVIPYEGAFSNTAGGTVGMYWGMDSQFTNGTGGTVTEANGFITQYSNAGTVAKWTDYRCGANVGTAPTLNYCLLNDDATKIIQTAGPVYASAFTSSTYTFSTTLDYAQLGSSSGVGFSVYRPVSGNSSLFVNAAAPGLVELSPGGPTDGSLKFSANGTGSLYINGPLVTGSTGVVASKTCTISALGASITITNGLVTATSGC